MRPPDRRAPCEVQDIHIFGCGSQQAACRAYPMMQRSREMISSWQIWGALVSIHTAPSMLAPTLAPSAEPKAMGPPATQYLYAAVALHLCS